MITELQVVSAAGVPLLSQPQVVQTLHKRNLVVYSIYINPSESCLRYAVNKANIHAHWEIVHSRKFVRWTSSNLVHTSCVVRFSGGLKKFFGLGATKSPSPNKPGKNSDRNK